MYWFVSYLNLFHLNLLYNIFYHRVHKYFAEIEKRDKHVREQVKQLKVHQQTEALTLKKSKELEARVKELEEVLYYIFSYYMISYFILLYFSNYKYQQLKDHQTTMQKSC